MAKAPIKKPIVEPARPVQPVQPVRSVTPVPEPAPESAALVERIETVEQVETVEMRKVQTRHRFPIYIPTQARHLMPEDIALVPLDWWVKNQLSLSDGALILAED